MSCMATYQLLLTKNIPLSQLLQAKRRLATCDPWSQPHVLCGRLTYVHDRNENEVRSMGGLGLRSSTSLASRGK